MTTNTERVDLNELKNSVDLLDLIRPNTVLTPKSKTRPLGEHAGACPFCGGVDRFVVWPTGRADGTPPMWMCRQCEPQGGTAIDYVMRRDHLSAGEAIALLAGEDAPARAVLLPPTPPRPVLDIEAELERAEHLADYWTRRADGLRAELTGHPEVLAQLQRDGISADAARYFGLGYTVHQSARALVIPWRYQHRGQDVVTGVQYRAILGDAFGDGDPRYRWLAGSRGKALFNADAILQPTDGTLVVVEGAKKAAALWSHHLTSTVAVASKTCWLPEWGTRLGAFERVVFALDPDASDQAHEAALTCGVPSYVAQLPMKPDDLLTATGGDVDLLWSYLSRARRVN